MVYGFCIIPASKALSRGYPVKSVICDDGKRRPRPLHRLTWIELRGSIPRGMCVLHKCNNKRCINIKHLKLGSRQQNSAEAARDGLYKAAKGERHGLAKLTTKQVERIKARLRNGDTCAAIARDYKMTHAAIRSIAIGRTWKHV